MILSAILLTGYLFLLGFLIYGYQKIPENTLKDCRNPTTRFSIIIPFRNESKSLPELLQTMVHLNYPEHLFEIIFVDDASEDVSAKMITTALFKGEISFKIIPNNRKSASPKKDAITTGISISKYDWILTTDADCKLPKNWLLAFDGYIRKNKPSMLAGPVRYFTGSGLINRYQQ